MAQQTAVNFLINYMCANFHLTDESLNKFEQALAMEKEQIINAWNSGYDCYQIDEELEINQTMFSAEKYFDYAYKSKEGTSPS